MRADTPEKKIEFLNSLLEVWINNPQLRFGQLIGNVYNYASGKDPYYEEDDVFIQKIMEAYSEE